MAGSLTGRSARASGGPRKRILVEARQESVRQAVARALEPAGFEVTSCAGPGPGHPCPLLEGRDCPLVDQADVVVHALQGLAGRAVREHLGPDVEVLTWPGEHDLLAEVYRLHARRVRHLRLPVTLHDGRKVVVRAVRPTDAGGLREFDAGLSERSRQLRYLGSKPPLTEDWARHLAEVDFDQRFALVAVTADGGAERIVADCRLLSNETVTGELAVVVADDYQGAGLGRLLVDLTLRIAAARGLPKVFADVRYDNRPMALLLRAEGFERTGWDLGVMTFVRTVG